MRTARALLVLLAATSAMSSMSTAQDLIDRRARREHQAAQSGISLDQAVKMAQKRYRSKDVKAETVDDGGRRVHRIRLLSAEGMVRTVHVDAQTGAMR